MLEHGSATLVLGVQFGDEGKGKLIDVLAENADLVCRVQGGNNAGHTIWIGNRKIVTHLLPSGILRENCEVAIGAGVVVDPFVLNDEISHIKSMGFDVSPERLHIDYRAHVILPYHKNLDLERELKRSAAGAAIGTTGRGIGPTYASKAYREGPRMADLLSKDSLQHWFKQHPYLELDLEKGTLDSLLEIGEKLKPHLKDVAMIANNRLNMGGRVLIEGAQGGMLDVSFGTYPFVTSSNLISGSCAGGLGIPPWRIRKVCGVFKAYATRVGNGPFPGELSGTLDARIREIGREFGSTTGRPRRVGWLDLVALRYFARINGLTSLSLMKSDVLTGFENIGIITAYKDSRTKELMDGWPMTSQAWDSVEPVVEFCEGWENIVDNEGKFHPRMNAFLQTIQDFVGVPIVYCSTGPERSEGHWFKSEL